MPLSLDDTFGFLQVEVRHGNATPSAAALDVWEAFNTYAQLRAKFEDAVELGAAWCEWLATRGLPELSHGAAFKVADALAAEVERAKKADTGSASAG